MATVTDNMKDASLAAIETIINARPPATGRNIEVVFRTVGERTGEKALELIMKNVRPNKIHIIRNVRPFSVAFERQLKIQHDCSHVVYVDPDCLILEDLRPFLDYNDLAFVGGYTIDRFLGLTPRGIHIVRSDVFERMRAHIDNHQFTEYLLNPETFLTKVALTGLAFNRQFKHFYALHDFMQSYQDIFAKYVLRGLKSQSIRKSAELVWKMQQWDSSPDLTVARQALQFCSNVLAKNPTFQELEKLLSDLPDIAATEVAKLNLPPQSHITDAEIDDAIKLASKIHPRRKTNKVFGIGLSRTGTASLTMALHTLDIDTVHYPNDRGTLETIKRGDGRFPLLDYYDSITDVTTIPFYKKLDKLYPGSRFILTVRDEESWLRSCRTHWSKEQNPKWPAKDTERYETKKEIKKMLREMVYGAYDFDEARFIAVYRRHIADVMEYFKGREQDLLVMNITEGDGYDKLAPFLGLPVPKVLFPHRNETGRSKREDILESIVETRLQNGE